MAGSKHDDKGRALYPNESQRKNLTYAYNYTDSAGKRRFIYAPTLEKLREKERELKEDRLNGIDTYLAKEATVNFLFDRYIVGKTNLRQRTKENYKLTYNRYARPYLGNRKIAELKYSDMVIFYQFLIKDKNLLLNTVKGVHNILHPAFELAVKDDIISVNPTEGALTEASRKPGRNHGVRHALTLEQQRSFMNYVKESKTFNHWLPLFTVMLGTGMRVGEVVGLRWDDLDFENDIIDVNHSVVYYAEEGAETTKSVKHVSLPKTEAGIRKIPMMPLVREAFETERKAQKKTGNCIGEIDGMTGFIFKNRERQVLNPQTINRSIKCIVANHNADEQLRAKREGRSPVILPEFSCHIFRHTFCTRLCEHEPNLKVIQDIMGHADFETTMDIYAEVTEMKKKEEFKVIGEIGQIF